MSRLWRQSIVWACRKATNWRQLGLYQCGWIFWRLVEILRRTNYKTDSFLQLFEDLFSNGRNFKNVESVKWTSKWTHIMLC
jgi:hypothetical protein